MIIFIYGNDTYRLREKLDFYRNGFLKKYGDMNVSFYDSDFDFNKIKNDVLSFPFLAEKRLVVIKGLLGSKNKDIQKQFSDFLAEVPEETVVLFCEEGEPDKRTSLFKELSKTKVIEKFDYLQGNSLINWIKNEVKKGHGEIDNNAADYLVIQAGNELWKLKAEIAKLLNYKKNIDKTAINLLVKSKTESNIFELMDYIGRKDFKNAEKKLQQITDAGENEIYILTMIIKQIKNLLLVKDLTEKGLGNDEIARKTKMHPFVIKKAVEQNRGFATSELISIYDDLVKTDMAVKTGQKDPRLALDLLLNKICK